MPGCAAIGCNNRSEKGYTMKCFPRDPALRKIWKQRVGRADWEPSNNSFLCAAHFEANQWVMTPSGKMKLKKGALPSIFTVTSTRKSPKKRQKLGVPPAEEDDLEEYEVEYLENDCPFIFKMDNQKVIPNIISVQTQNATITSGQILQNVKFISGDALKDLQNENIIIVADEHNREIGKIINDNGFLYLGSERGKENIHLSSKSDKPTPTEIKIEVKEEVSENGLTAHDYDEIERKLKEICHSENETDSSNNNKDSPKKVSNPLTESESPFSLDDLENGLESAKDSSNQEIESDTSAVRTGMKRKRKIKTESLIQENSRKTSQSFSKTEEAQFSDDVTEIINDLETESSIESTLHQSKYTPSIIAKQNSQTNGACISSVKNDIQLMNKNNIVNGPAENKKANVTAMSNLKSSNKLIAKLNVQGEVIEKLTSELIMYKDMDRKMQSLTQELQNKNKEIEALMRKTNSRKSFIEKKTFRSDSADLKDASETDLRNRIDFLEDNNKKLMKTVTLENQNRRKLECQIKSRDNQIKELNWKLEKASKFLDRAEKNTNNYRKKMLNMQALIRRKKLLNEKGSILDEFLIGQSNQNFSENTMQIALEIEKVCGLEGYQKLLNYEFPLPTLKELSRKYPTEIEYCRLDKEEVIASENRESDSNTNEISAVDIKMENVEYLDPDFLNDTDETITGTVQDIFNESSDSDELDLHELRKHIMIDLDVTT